MTARIIRTLGIWVAAAVLVVSTAPASPVSAFQLDDITTKLQLTGSAENCGLMLNWTTLSTPNEAYIDGYALFRLDLDSKTPFAMLRKTNLNKNYYHFVNISAGTYVWKVAPYSYDIQGFKYGKMSDAVTLNVTCGVAPVPAATPAPAPTPAPKPVLPVFGQKATVGLSVVDWVTADWTSGTFPKFTYTMNGNVAFDAYRLERWTIAPNGIKVPGSFKSYHVDKWSSSMTLYEVTPGTTYSFRIVAVKNVGGKKKIVAQASNSLKVAIPAAEVSVGVPEIISPDENAVLTQYPRQALLRWAPMPGMYKFHVEIQCDTCGDTDWQTIQTYSTSDNSYFTPELPGDNEYRFRVQAMNHQYVEGEWSEYSYFSFDTSK